MKIPEKIITIMKSLTVAGYEAYVIGGAVRDFYMGKEPHDYDIFTNATGEQILKLFPKGIVLGNEERQEKILTVIVDGTEVSQYRKNGNRTEVGNNIITHLSTCDFTVNAIACNINGDILDPYGGRIDIKNRSLTFVGNAHDRIKEDPLRILRGIRFWGILGHFKDYGVVLKYIDLLDTIPKERIREEFMKILETNILETLLSDRTIILKIMPELKECYGVEGGKFHDEDVITHMKNAFVYASKITDNVLLRLAIFLHDIGKGVAGCIEKDGEWHFYEHEGKGEELVKQFMDRLKFSKTDIIYITTLIRLHMYSYKGSPGKKSHMKFFIKLKEANIPIEDYVMLLYCDHQANGKKPRFKFGDFIKGNRLIHKYYEYTYSKEPFSIKELELTGHDVMKYGLKGKEVGDTLKKIFEEVLEGNIKNERPELLTKLKDLVKVETCCVCDGPCEMNTEYDGSAVCMDKKCSVHNEE